MTKVISVYFNGTDDSSAVNFSVGKITLAAILHEMTAQDGRDRFSICINGCGIETQDIRDLGGIFTFHLEKQVLRVVNQVENILKNSQEPVVLNAYGFSRGGAATFLLCQKLKHIPADRLTINVASFEPVPGNYIMNSYADILLGTNNTLSAEVADLTQCKNVKNMLVLFTNEPLPDIACHAPILPAYPASCRAEIDVTPGCHKGAVSFYKFDVSIEAKNNESAIVFHRIVEFLQKCGTCFDFKKFNFASNLIYSSGEKIEGTNRTVLLNMYGELTLQKAWLDGREKKRAMHLGNSIFTSCGGQSYLNRYHQQLSNVDRVTDDRRSVLFTLQEKNPTRMTAQYREATKLMQLVFTLAIMWMIYNKFMNQADSTENLFKVF